MGRLRQLMHVPLSSTDHNTGENDMSELATIGEWKQDSEYGWSHPAGWTIGRYLVNGLSRFMLWQGREHKGRFDSFEDAVKQHRTIHNG